MPPGIARQKNGLLFWACFRDEDGDDALSLLLKDLGIDAVQMYTETGEKDIVLYAAK